jgi:hypothetical protein
LVVVAAAAAAGAWWLEGMVESDGDDVGEVVRSRWHVMS